MKLHIEHIPSTEEKAQLESGVIENDPNQKQIHPMVRMFCDMKNLKRNPRQHGFNISEMIWKFFLSSIEAVKVEHHLINGKDEIHLSGGEKDLIIFMFVILSQDDSLPDDPLIADSISIQMPIWTMITFWNYAYPSYPIRNVSSDK